MLRSAICSNGLFSDPERLRPGLTRQVLTERAAASFAQLAQGFA